MKKNHSQNVKIYFGIFAYLVLNELRNQNKQQEEENEQLQEIINLTSKGKNNRFIILKHC